MEKIVLSLPELWQLRAVTADMGSWFWHTQSLPAYRSRISNWQWPLDQTGLANTFRFSFYIWTHEQASAMECFGKLLHASLEGWHSDGRALWLPHLNVCIPEVSVAAAVCRLELVLRFLMALCRAIRCARWKVWIKLKLWPTTSGKTDFKGYVSNFPPNHLAMQKHNKSP